MATIAQKDQKYIWHPFTQMKTAKSPIVITKGKGTYLYSEDGRSFIDGISSWWVNLHGHANLYIAKKIKEQAAKLEHVIFADFTHQSAVELAERLIKLLPDNMAKIFYSDNGSTAVEIAIKMALQYWYNKNRSEKIKLICFKDSYHGDTFGAMSASGKNTFNRPFWKHLFEVVSITPPFNNKLEKSEQELIFALSDAKAACFLFEPLILGVGGMMIYPSKNLDSLLKICKEKEVITIADEVMTGFGRTGSLFASDQTTYKPDIICLSKGITGGFLPLGVTACKQAIFNAFLSYDKQKAFLHGHSYTANPIACASALASLDLLEIPKCMQKIKMIEKLHFQFCKKWQDHPKLKRLEVLGTILALEYHFKTSSYFSSLRDLLYNFFLSKNILLRPLGNVLYILPPYCISKRDLEYIYNNIILTLEGDL
jgi:adenosylmethionine---8-amino-7-oxononanoate aminotransferase